MCENRRLCKHICVCPIISNVARLVSGRELSKQLAYANGSSQPEVATSARVLNLCVLYLGAEQWHDTANDGGMSANVAHASYHKSILA